MALSGWSTEDFLRRLDANWPGQLPFGVSMWLYIPSTASGGATPFVLGTAGQNDHRRSVIVNGNTDLAVHVRDTNFAVAILGAPPTDQWFHVAAFYEASNFRGGLIDGAGQVTNSDLRSVAAPDSTFIGIRPDLLDPFYLDGAIASVSVWNLDGFSTQDRTDWATTLAGGSNPGDMDADIGQPWAQALVDYTALNDTDDLGTYTQIGDLVPFASHPPVEGEGGLFSVVLWETSAETVPISVAPFSVVLWESTVGTAAEAPVAHAIVGDVTITLTPEADLNFVPAGTPDFAIVGDVTIQLIPEALFTPPVDSEIYTTYEAVGQREDLGWRHPIRRRDTLIIIEPEDDSIRRNLSIV